MASSASECGTSKADQNTKCRIDLDPSQHRKYTFPTEQIPRLDVSDPKVSEYVRDGVSMRLKEMFSSESLIHE